MATPSQNLNQDDSFNTIETMIDFLLSTETPLLVSTDGATITLAPSSTDAAADSTPTSSTLSSSTASTSPQTVTWTTNKPSTVLFFIAIAIGVIIALLFIFFTTRYLLRTRVAIYLANSNNPDIQEISPILLSDYGSLANVSRRSRSRRRRRRGRRGRRRNRNNNNTDSEDDNEDNNNHPNNGNANDNNNNDNLSEVPPPRIMGFFHHNRGRNYNFMAYQLNILNENSHNNININNNYLSTNTNRRRTYRYLKRRKLSKDEVEYLFPKRSYIDWLNGGAEKDALERNIHDEIKYNDIEEKLENSDENNDEHNDENTNTTTTNNNTNTNNTNINTTNNNEKIKPTGNSLDLDESRTITDSRSPVINDLDSINDITNQSNSIHRTLSSNTIHNTTLTSNTINNNFISNPNPQSHSHSRSNSNSNTQPGSHPNNDNSSIINEKIESDITDINPYLNQNTPHYTSGLCAICIEQFDDNDTVRGLICGHVFHSECIDPWLITRKASCPTCKRDYFIKNSNLNSNSHHSNRRNRRNRRNNNNNNNNSNSNNNNNNNNTENNQSHENTNNNNTSSPAVPHLELLAQEEIDALRREEEEYIQNLRNQHLNDNNIYNEYFNRFRPLDHRSNEILMANPEFEQIAIDRVNSTFYTWKYWILWQILGVKKRDLINCAIICQHDRLNAENNLNNNNTNNDNSSSNNNGNANSSNSQSHPNTNPPTSVENMV
ncbi:RING-H2 finger protein ASCRUDRAFT_75652 [Ascoidea rubescens DSM 1968]|uniref:RING-type domain-containing protein n=1 Tax=Ascoidea rubescens DSM 1968 TaxID=1344418 RepID=A0A1D2VJD1_9ASCO|nr:hypothetical protein ASCRUDRAFT_75652 [Ascoidea rubescens DSM 1968]ODV61673.1 hypothetical protein ASCRUDRAFT_75652 [Ascoidea rubescens DSM 1968]